MPDELPPQDSADEFPDDFADDLETADPASEESPDNDTLFTPEPPPEVTRLASVLEEAGPQRAQQALFLAGMHFSGPLPPAREIMLYNESGNGLGTRMGEDFLTQRSHERKMDRVQVRLAHRDADRADREQRIRSGSLIYTYVLMTCLIIGAFYLIAIRHPGYAVTLLSPALLAVFGVIIRQIVSAGENSKLKK